MPKRRNFMPTIIERAKDGSEIAYDVFSRLIKDRILFLSESIDSDVASAIAATLLFLDKENSDEPIHFYINSPGGTVEDGLFVIYDIMYMIKAPIHTYCVGQASSAAAVILSAGEKGNRYALPNSRIMIHQVSMNGEISGSSAEIAIISKSVNYLNDKLIEILARHTGKTKAKILKDCSHDYFMTAEDAVKYGLVDHVLDPSKTIPELIKPGKKLPKHG